MFLFFMGVMMMGSALAGENTNPSCNSTSDYGISAYGDVVQDPIYRNNQPEPSGNADRAYGAESRGSRDSNDRN